MLGKVILDETIRGIVIVAENLGSNAHRGKPHNLRTPKAKLTFKKIKLTQNKKHLKNVGPIRHCEPPHAHSPGVATVASAIGVQRVEMHQHAKLRHNRSIGCEDIKIFPFFKMAAVRHLGFVWGIFGPPTMSIWGSLSLYKIWL